MRSSFHRSYLLTIPASFALNPQYLVKAREKTVVTVILSQPEEEFDTVGFYIVKTKDPHRRLTKFPAADILSKTEFGSHKEGSRSHRTCRF